MRVLLFVFLFIFGLNVSAQSPAVNNLFSGGTRHANADRFDDALKIFKTTLFMAENEYLGAGYRARLHYNIGVCHFRMDRFELAANQFKSAIILKSDYIHAHYALGMARMRLREWKAAAKSFESLLTNDPNNGEAWFDLAFAKLAVGDTDAAESSFAKSIEFGSLDSVLSHNNIGVILAVKGDLLAAEKAFETAIALSRDRLPEAKRNLDFCRSKRAGKRELIAGEFRYSFRSARLSMA